MSESEMKTELKRILEEKELLRQKEKKLDERLAALHGLLPKSKQRKDRKKTYSPQEYARACGV